MTMVGTYLFLALFTVLTIRLYSKHHKAAHDEASRIPLDGESDE